MMPPTPQVHAAYPASTCHLYPLVPNLAINGDMGWVSSGNRRNIEMFRYWNRIIKMDLNRITKKVFTWDFVKRRSVGSWNSDILKLFSSLNMGNIYHNLMGVNLTLVKEKLLDTQMHQWETNIVQVPKLRTYCTFKRIFSVEPYVYKVFSRAHRSILAQFRNGILPLKIETGRYTQIPIEFRLCILCNEDQIENECHFLFECDFYQHIRDIYYQGFREHCNNFDVMNHTEKLNYLMSADVVKTTAEFIYKCYCKRREFIYK